MAIFNEPADPYMAAKSASGGSGLDQILDFLMNKQKEAKQQKSSAAGFEAAGLSPEQSQAFSKIANQKTLDQLLKMIGQKQQVEGRQSIEAQKMGLLPGQPKTNKRMARIMANKNLAARSRKIKEYIAKGKELPPNLKKFLKAKKGLTDESLMMLTSDKKLTKEKAEVIMRWANGDVEKARNLARRWGFDIPLADYEKEDVSELLNQ